ncbi:hypothetical protein KKE28_03335 [Patescibacteria group bacterium]|nr:hypothetical protein [Patescibacteria group bacterium]MBU1915867.1 hypothetical protein [Patescibacteria group bacterium]
MNLLSELDNQRISDGSPGDVAKPGAASSRDNNAPPPPIKPVSPETEERGSSVGGLRVSLMPAGEEEEGGSVRRCIIILLALIFFETLAAGAGYLFMVNRETELKEKRAGLEQRANQLADKIKLAEGEAKEVAQFNTQADIAGKLLDNHLYWTEVFKHLSDQTKKSVRYINFAGDFSSRMISMDAVGRNYRDVAEQIMAFREDPTIMNVDTTSASARVNERGEIEGVSFSLVLTIKPEVWLATSENENGGE